MPKRPNPEITEAQIEELRKRKIDNSGSMLKYLDITSVFGEKFPIALVLARGLLPDDLHREFLANIISQELFFARVEDLLADFLDGLAKATAPPDTAAEVFRLMVEKGYILAPNNPPPPQGAK